MISVLWWILLLPALVFISGCGTKEASGTRPTVITYAHYGSTESAALVKSTIDAFNESVGKEMGVEVKQNHILGTAYQSKIQCLIAANMPLDIFMALPEMFNSFVRKNTLLDLGPFMENDKQWFDEYKKDLFPGLLDVYYYRGNLYGMPRNGNTVMMYFNKTMFDREGLKYPDEKWTWGDFEAACRKLTRKGQQFGTYIDTGQLGAIGDISLLAWGNGASIFNEDNTRCVMDTPSIWEPLQWWADLMNKERVSPTSSQGQTQGAVELFLTGRLGMFFSGYWLVPKFRRIRNFEWDVAPLPKGRKGRFTIGGPPDGWGISKTTKHPEAAWEFLKFLAGKQGQIIQTDFGNDVPTLKSVAYSEHFLNPALPPKNARIFLEGREYARNKPVTNYEIESVMWERLGSVYLGKITAEEYCRKVTPEINKLLDEFNQSAGEKRE